MGGDTTTRPRLVYRGAGEKHDAEACHVSESTPLHAGPWQVQYSLSSIPGGSSSRSAFSIRRPCIDAAWILPSQQSFLVDYYAESSKPFNIPHRRFSASGYSGSCGYRDCTETTICLYFNRPLSTTTSTEQRHTVVEGCLYPSQRPGRAAGGSLPIHREVKEGGYCSSPQEA